MSGGFVWGLRRGFDDDVVKTRTNINIGVNALQTFLLPPPSSPLSLSPLRSPPNQARGSGGALLRAEPGYQTYFGAFRSKNEAFHGTGHRFLVFLQTKLKGTAMDLFYDGTRPNHTINYVDENSASYA